jgi:DNA polymerase
MGITLWEQRWSPQQVFTKGDASLIKDSVTSQASATSSSVGSADQKVTAEEPPNESLALDNITAKDVDPAPQQSLNAALEPPNEPLASPAKLELDPAPQQSLHTTHDLLTEQAVTSPELADTDERAIRISQMDWGSLETEVSGCVACDLHKSRTQTVFGVGNRQAEWMIIGEAPGAEEDRLGEPFVGRAGKLLDAMLQALGLNREKVFIANILKCRPPKNRDPSPQEAHCCRPFLKRQISLIKPRIIVAVGRIAAQNLLQTQVPVGKLRGRVHHLEGTEIPVIVSYHPAYLLRSPREKRKAWDDLQLAQRISLAAQQITNG